jgi:hypothetical protein
MTLAALVDAGVDLAAIQAGIDSLGLPSCRLVASEVKRHGFRATHIQVEHEPEQAHRHLHHITDMIVASRLTERQKEMATKIFTRLGEAEAKVHGTTLRKVHFHEVGAVDSIADIVGAAIGLDLLGVEQIVASPIPTGTGFIEIAHGRCSVPAPATAELLLGIPLAASTVEAELTTPTGAAIVATMADRFGPLPAMSITKIGYGAGSRELETQPNILRLVLGETVGASGGSGDQVWMLETNLDDMSGQWIGYCTAKLLEAGALDVYATPIQMKKNRPGVLLSVLCREADLSALEAIVFRESTTLGVRRWPVSRTTLERSSQCVTTPYGEVEGKRVTLPGQDARFSPEYESCRRAAEQEGVPLRLVYEAAQRAFAESASGR